MLMSTCGVWRIQFAGSPVGVDNLSDLNMQQAGACCPTFLTHSVAVLLVWKPLRLVKKHLQFNTT